MIVATENDAPLALVPGNFAPANILGVAGFLGLVIWLYSWMLRRARAV